MPTSAIPRRVVVKFHDTVDLPYEDGAGRHVTRLGLGPWTALAHDFEGIRLDRLFKVVEPGRLGELVSLARSRDDHYRPSNLRSYFVIRCPAGENPAALAAALREWASVDTAYVDPLDQSPAPAGANPSHSLQTYLDPPATAAPPAPQGGIDAKFAWAQPGGTGSNQKIVDLERGANPGQQDIVARGISRLHGIDPVYDSAYDRLHGAKVLCIVAAVDNNVGIVGIAYGVGVGGVAHTSQVVNANPADPVDRPNAVVEAIEHFMQAGDNPIGRVLLLEVELGRARDEEALTHVNGSVWERMPMETALADYEVIRLATALGIVVVEAAGNGGHKLDDFEQQNGGFVLRRTPQGSRPDSGAIMVAGSTADYPYRPTIPGPMRTCFGTRIDCFAWAERVATCVAGTNPDTYTANFGGSSSAAAIVAGAALLVEGVAEQTLGQRLPPSQLRAFLSDENVNTRSFNHGVDLIGVMPNLKRILQDVLGVAPDVYMRDHVGDNGAVHAGAISLSPDIIVRTAAEPQPQVAFGPGTENDLTLGQTVTTGQDHFVYVRVWNRATHAAAVATNVKATVYYAAPATLLTADDWTLIDEVTIPTVPPNNVMTVSPAITWPKGKIPAAGHYCFIAVVDHGQDPAPTRAQFLDFDYFNAYIRTNNNVTWRNFNVVALPAPPPPADPSGGEDEYAFDFAARGAADFARRFRFEIAADLPPGAVLKLEAPVSLLGDRLPFDHVHTGTQRARIAIAPDGRTELSPVVLPAKFRAACRLLVRMSRKDRDADHEVYVRQLYEDFEVGRVTWRVTRDAPN